MGIIPEDKRMLLAKACTDSVNARRGHCCHVLLSVCHPNDPITFSSLRTRGRDAQPGCMWQTPSMEENM